MPTNQRNLAERLADAATDGASANHPSTEEVVARLDRLWSGTPDEPIGPPPSLAGYQVGRFAVERVIGRGAFGIVYKAYDPQLDRDVALKIPRPEVLLDNEQLRRFESEAQAAARLDHPSIVPVHEAELGGAIPYIASTYCPGPNLAEWMQDQVAPLRWQEAAQFMAQLASAIHYAHEQGVIHRDLKPSNVLLAPQGDAATRSLSDYQPRLTDFGMARLAKTSLADTRSSLLLGTPLYMAPEQLYGDAHANLSASVDVYALGVMLFQLLSGELPINGASFVQLVDRLREASPERLKNLRPDVPKALDAICAKCLEKDPAARYASAAELARDLIACERGELINVPRVSVWDRFRYWRTQPQRIRDAGWYGLCVQGLFAPWLLMLAVALTRFDVLSLDEYFSTLVQIAAAVAGAHLPMLFVSWQTLRRRPWAVWTGFLLSMPNLFFPLMGLVGAISIFPHVYRDAEYHAFAATTLICGAMGIQLLLYGFAVLAQRKIVVQARSGMNPEIA